MPRTRPRARPARHVKPKPRPKHKLSQREPGFDPAKLPDVVKMLAEGKTLATVAERLFHVWPQRISEWRKLHPELAEAIETGLSRYWESACDNCERVLVASATGRVPKTVNEVRDAAGRLTGERVVEYHPPSVAAGVFVTCNKRPDKWQNVQRVEVRRDGEGPRPIVFVVAGAPVVKGLALDPSGAIVQELPGGNGHDGPKALEAEISNTEDNDDRASD